MSDPYLTLFTSSNNNNESELDQPETEPEAAFVPLPRPPYTQPQNVFQRDSEMMARMAAQQTYQQMRQTGMLHPPSNAQGLLDSFSDPFLRRKLIFMILHWEQAFPVELKGIIPSRPKLNSMDTEQLRILLQDVKFTVGLSNSATLENMVSGEIFQVLEGMLKKYTPIKAQGVGQALSENKMFQKILKESILDATEAVYTQPKIRALAMGAKVIWDAHIHNGNVEEQKLFLDSPFMDPDSDKPDPVLLDIALEMENLDKQVDQLVS